MNAFPHCLGCTSDERKSPFLSPGGGGDDDGMLGSGGSGVCLLACGVDEAGESGPKGGVGVECREKNQGNQ